MIEQPTNQLILLLIELISQLEIVQTLYSSATRSTRLVESKSIFVVLTKQGICFHVFMEWWRTNLNNNKWWASCLRYTIVSHSNLYFNDKTTGYIIESWLTNQHYNLQSFPRLTSESGVRGIDSVKFLYRSWSVLFHLWK